MIRKLITIGLPLLAPLIVYVAYNWARYRRRKAEEEGQPIPHWQEWPWVILIASGVLLMAASLIGTSFLDRKERETDYSPPRMENGEIVPGDFSGD